MYHTLNPLKAIGLVSFKKLRQVPATYTRTPSLLLLLKLPGTNNWEKGHPYKRGWAQNHDTQQAIEQRKETKKIKLSPLKTQAHRSLKRAQGATTKHTRWQQVQQTHSSMQKRPTELIGSAARGQQRQLTQGSYSSSITRCNKIRRIPMHRVVRIVINLIEQTQGTALHSVPQITKFVLT